MTSRDIILDASKATSNKQGISPSQPQSSGMQGNMHVNSQEHEGVAVCLTVATSSSAVSSMALNQLPTSQLEQYQRHPNMQYDAMEGQTYAHVSQPNCVPASSQILQMTIPQAPPSVGITSFAHQIRQLPVKQQGMVAYTYSSSLEYDRSHVPPQGQPHLHQGTPTLQANLASHSPQMPAHVPPMPGRMASLPMDNIIQVPPQSFQAASANFGAPGQAHPVCLPPQTPNYSANPMPPSSTALSLPASSLQMQIGKSQGKLCFTDSHGFTRQLTAEVHMQTPPTPAPNRVDNPINSAMRDDVTFQQLPAISHEVGLERIVHVAMAMLSRFPQLISKPKRRGRKKKTLLPEPADQMFLNASNLLVPGAQPPETVSHGNVGSAAADSNLAG